MEKKNTKMTKGEKSQKKGQIKTKKIEKKGEK